MAKEEKEIKRRKPHCSHIRKRQKGAAKNVSIRKEDRIFFVVILCLQKKQNVLSV
jgi:hypothetical protein